MNNQLTIKDLLFGLAIGDAYGAGVEFQDRNWIAENVDFN
ncbi:MAG: ADP-ribosylglycohydrolase [Halioglobus sp.]|jgi:ADP-ribosylglycohydrolase